MKMHAQALTDVGRKRPHNEDCFLADDGLGLYIACDGMGGHAAGEVASALCVDFIRQGIVEGGAEIERMRRDPTPKVREAACRVMEGAIQRASKEIYQIAQAEAQKRGMGTTAVAIVVAGNKAVIGHVGDSRIYLLRAGQVHRLTEDHTLVQAQIKAGLLTKQEAETSQYRNVITRAVGIQESVQVDTLVVDLLPGDVYLLCTDGLHGYLQDEELPKVLGESKDLGASCRRLIDLANERGGKDNITAILVACEGAGATQGAVVDAAEAELTSDAEARLQAIRAMPLFRHLTYKEQMAVLAAAHAVAFEPRMEIVVQGSVGDEMFVVVRGRVGIESGGVQVAELRTGGHFGEMSIVDNAPRSATVRALEPTRCMVLRRADILQLMRREPVLAVKLLWSFVQALSDRLRTANAELSEAKGQTGVHSNPFTEG
ncbi:MAG: Stp1/IreP family PP2C-type Ser/Thr phosphatase [Deltaproteobacteria bacterium]